MSQEIKKFIEHFNNSWTMGNAEDIVPLLDDKIIFLAPDLETEIKGKDNCVKTIKDYSKNAVTNFFEVTENKIHTWNNTAMVTLKYYVEYEMNNKHYKEKGTEFWTLNKLNESWRLVWRALINNEEIK